MNCHWEGDSTADGSGEQCSECRTGEQRGSVRTGMQGASTQRPNLLTPTTQEGKRSTHLTVKVLEVAGILEKEEKGKCV